MELRHLRYFVAAAEEMNFSRAAIRMNVAQPALSRRIQALEAELGFPLFFRDKKRVSLTPAGSSFFTACRRVIDELNVAKNHASKIARTQRAKLVIGLNPAAAFSTEIMEVLTDLNAGSHDLDTELLTMTSPALLTALHDRKIDVGFVHVNERPKHLKIAKVCEGWLVIAINQEHPLATKPHLIVDDLKEEPFVWVREEEATFAHFKALEAFYECGFHPHVVHRTSSFQASLEMVSAGAGHSLAHSIANARKPTNVVFRNLTDFELPLPVMLAWRADSSNREIMHLLGMFENKQKSTIAAVSLSSHN